MENTKLIVMGPIMKNGYQDIIELTSLVFIQRHFLEDILEKGLDPLLEEIQASGDLTAEQKATFEACIHNPRLQAVIKEWWTVYDEDRADGTIPAVRDPWVPV